MPALTVLMKPVSGNCNMRCKYCFYRDVISKRMQKNMGIMTSQVAEHVIKQVFDYCGESGIANFVFQGGEPTLWGLVALKDFVKMVRKYQNDYSCEVNFALQTNGLLLDEAYVEFLKAEHFLVGVSLDGSAVLHNANRVDTFGEGTYDRVMTAIRILAEHNVDYNILCVITKMHINYPKQLYSFFQKHNFKYVQLIPCIEELGSLKNEYIPQPERYGYFLCKIFNLWLKSWEDKNPVSIRDFDNLAAMVLNKEEPELCTMRGTCSINAVVEADGSVYPCDFYVIDEWRLGNILQNDLSDLLKGTRMKEFLVRASNVTQRCIQCGYYNLCRCGCSRMRISVSNGEFLFRLCEAEKIFLPYALERMPRLETAMYNCGY